MEEIAARVVESPPPSSMYLPHSEEEARSAFFSRGVKTAVLKYYERATADSAPAQAVVASMYLNGWIADADAVGSAIVWARKSAAMNDDHGAWLLAWLLLEKGQVKDGMENMMLSAERGFPPAIFNLGSFLVYGVVFPKDPVSGFRFIRAAADLGHASARRTLESAKKLGHFGKMQMIVTRIIQPLLKPFRFLFWLVFEEKFGPGNLVYLRSLHVENALRRRVNKEAISFELEDRLDNMVSKIRT